MIRHRRLSAALVVSLALAALITAATVGGGAERRGPVAGAEVVLQGQHAEVALTPAKRQLADPTSLVLAAVLTALFGLAATSARVNPAARHRAGALPAERRHAFRLRGPPVLQYS